MDNRSVLTENQALKNRVSELERQLAENSRRCSLLERMVQEAPLNEQSVREINEYALWMASFPEQNPNPVMRVSVDGIVLYCNHATAKMPGRNMEIGQPVPDPILALVQQSFELEREVQQDVAVGEMFYSISVMPFPSENYANIYGRDVTKRIQTEQAYVKSQQRINDILSSISDGLMAIDRDWNLVFVNDLAAEIAGSPADQVIGKNLWETWPKLVGTSIEQYYRQAMLERAPANFRMQGLYTSTWYDVSVYPSSEGISVYFIDRTDQIKAEQLLQEYALRLEHSNRDLEEFAYLASHDLQEPLRKIEAFGDLLMETSKNLDENQLDYLRRMQNAASRMRRMVDDLLVLSRVDRITQSFVRTDLNQVVQEALSLLEMQVQRTAGQVEVGPLPEIEADPVQLQQLFQNLINNALKFHPVDRPPVVKIYAGRNNIHSVQIFVEDNGIGFPETDVERIFQPFQRLVGRGQYEGNGMGLAICRKIVARHNGSISARSSPGVGSTFIITLPL